MRPKKRRLSSMRGLSEQQSECRMIFENGDLSSKTPQLSVLSLDKHSNPNFSLHLVRRKFCNAAERKVCFRSNGSFPPKIAYCENRSKALSLDNCTHLESSVSADLMPPIAIEECRALGKNVIQSFCAHRCSSSSNSRTSCPNHCSSALSACF